MAYITEPEKQVNIAYDVDVAVAGSGPSGVFAAIASARMNCSTVLVDRFGEPGGVMTVGNVFGRLRVEPGHVPKGYAGIPKEFLDKHEALGGKVTTNFQGPHTFMNSCIASYVLIDMLRESGVHLMLSTFVTDPIVENGQVSGFFVENKSGRQAVKAKIVIDATGEADLVRRAGAAVLYPEPDNYIHDKHAPTGMAIWYTLGGVDWGRYQSFVAEQGEPDQEDIDWAEKNLPDMPPGPLLSRVRRAFEKGEYLHVWPIENLEVEKGPASLPDEAHQFGTIRPGLNLAEVQEGVAGARVACIRGINAADGNHISELEAQTRMRVFETARFWKDYVPGFENSFLMNISPFLGNRGGPCIQGDYVMTVEDVEKGAQFANNLFVFRPSGVKYKPKWTEFPYRAMLPRELDNVLAVGRSASCRPDTLLRGAHMVPHMGQAAGAAAALAVGEGVTPRQINVKSLQKHLFAEGFYLGDGKRLRDLGLSE